MSVPVSRTVLFASRWPAIIAVCVTMLCAMPRASAQGETSTQQLTQPQGQPQTQPSHPSRSARRAQSVDQRITQLHTELQITPAEENDWNAVAQIMRDNATMLRNIAREKANLQNPTALDDLQAYQRFAQAHVEGLNRLVPAFQTLYNSMPDQQKKLADQVFFRSMQRAASRQGQPSRG